MDDIEMCDAFRLPAPSQATTDWLSSGTLHELAPKVGIVQWQASDTRCSALNSLRQEVMVPDRPVSALSPLSKRLSSSSRGSEAQPSDSNSSSGSIPSRRRSGIHRYRHGPNSPTACEPSASLQQLVPQLEAMIRSVAGAVDEGARQKKREIQQKQEKPSARALSRTHSARQVQSEKKRPMTRHMSAELVDKTNVASRSRLRDTVSDLEWESHLREAKIVASDEPRLPRTYFTKTGMKREQLTVDFAHDRSFDANRTHTKVRALATRADPAARARHGDVFLADSLAMPPPPDPLPPPDRSHQAKHISVTPIVLSHAPTPSSDSAKLPSQSQPSELVCSQPSSRPPPALGMRRVNTYNGTSTSQTSQTLPIKQRGFKTPFVRTPAFGSQTSSASSSISISRMSFEVTSGSTTDFSDTMSSPPRKAKSRPPMKEESRSPSPSPLLEADSSYGDISFDMDEVEETMKQYDKI